MSTEKSAERILKLKQYRRNCSARGVAGQWMVDCFGAVATTQMRSVGALPEKNLGSTKHQ